MIMANSDCLLLLLCAVYFLVSTQGGSGNHEFREDSGCRCIGSNVTLQCKVVGNSGWITWTGSALDCSYSGNEITFSFPDSFLGGRATKTCNSGEIIGQTLPVKNNNVYLSQLNVILSSYLIGRTVRCVYYVNATDHVLIGAVNLSSTTDPFPPPADVHLADMGQGFLKFKWSPAVNNCVPLQYEINATKSCGVCPNHTELTSVSCTVDVSHTTDSEVCSFSIRSIVCNNITGSWSVPVNITQLKVPDPIIITDNSTVVTIGNNSTNSNDVQPNRMTTVVVSICAPISVLFVITLLIIAVTVIYRTHRCLCIIVEWLSKLAGSHSTRVTHYNMQCHAVFKLEDMPGELMKVLIILKQRCLDIEEMKIGRHTPADAEKIYMRFTRDLEEADVLHLKSSEFHETIEVYKSAINISIDLRKTNIPTEIKESQMAYSRVIPSKPGALLSLLEGIMNLQGNDGGNQYKEVNITGIGDIPIKLCNKRLCYIITLNLCNCKFPSNWQRDFDTIKIQTDPGATT